MSRINTILRRRHAFRKSPATGLSRAVGILAFAAVFACLLLAVYAAANLAVSSARSDKGGIAVRAAHNNGVLKFKDGRALKVSYSGNAVAAEALRNGSARPLSLASADFDHDGAPDLISGYATSGGGILTIQKGNVEAFAPTDSSVYDRAAKGELPPSFVSNSTAIQLPESPDFVLTDDLNSDGQPDLLAAAKGGSLYQLINEGDRGFGAPEKLELPGQVTALTAGVFADGKAARAVVAAVVGDGGPALAIFDEDKNGIARTPKIISLPAAASSLVLGSFDDDQYPDLAVAAGNHLLIVHGQKTAAAAGSGIDLPSRIEKIDLGFEARDLAAGSFDQNGSSKSKLAAMSADGTIHVFEAENGSTDTRSAAGNPYAGMSSDEIKVATRKRAVIQSSETAMWLPDGKQRWAEVNQLGGAGAAQGTPALLSTSKLSGRSDDLLVLDAANKELKVLAGTENSGARSAAGGPVSLSLNSAPVAAIAMPQKINGDRDLMMLSAGNVAPIVVPFAGTIFYLVDSAHTADNTTTTPLSGSGTTIGDPFVMPSLRGAVLHANKNATTATITVQSGTFNLSVNNPGGFATGDGTIAFPDLEAGSGTLSNVTIVGTGATKPIIKQTIANNDVITTGFNTAGNAAVVTLSLQNLEITGGTFTGIFTGVGVNSVTKSNTIITNCNIHDNSNSDATFGQGGAIFNQCGDLSITGSTFTNNSANGAGDGQGGAIFYDIPSGSGNCTAGTLSITGSTFTLNKSKIGAGFPAGGAAFISLGVAAATGTISTTTFDQNQATGGGDGGALAFLISNTTPTVTESTFTNNAATNASGHGGAIHQQTGNSTVNFCRFFGNSTTTATNGKIISNIGSSAPHTVSAPNNWWASNTGPAAGTDIFTSGGATVTTSPFIVLTHTANAQEIRINQTSTLTADMSKDSNGSGAALSGNLFVLLQLPVTFTGAAPAGSTISHTPSAIQPLNIASAAEAGNTVTITTSVVNGYTIGNTVTIAGVGVAGYNGTFTITGTPTTSSFTYTNPTAGLGASSGGTASVGATGTATETFTAGGTAGRGEANATVDGVVAGANERGISSATEAGSTATITTIGAHGFSTNEWIWIAGVGVAGYNGGPFQVASTPTVNTFTYTPGTSGLGASSGGTADGDIVVLQPPAIAKSFGAATIPINGDTTAIFTITNANVVPINTSFVDTLPSGLQVAAVPGVTNTCGGAVTAVAGAGTISFSSNLTPVGTPACSISVHITGTVDNNYTNSVSILSTDAGNGNTSSANLTVINPPNIVKAFGAPTIPLNGTTSMTFTIDSNGNQNLTQTGVAFTDNLPAGLVVATPGNPTTTCAGGTVTAANGSSTVSLAGASIPKVSSCTVSVTVQGTTAGVKNNNAPVTSTNAGAGNTGSASITVVAPPTISKAFGASSVPLNGSTSVTFTISNPNATVDLSGVAFSDTLPSATGTLVVATPNGLANTCGGSVTATSGTGVISLSGGSVTKGTSCTLSVNVTGTQAGDANNTAGAVSSTEGGTGVGSNTALLKVVAPPTISKAFGAANIPLNGTTTVTFTITNPAVNTTSETGIAFSDTLTNGLKVAATPGVTNTCNGTVTAGANTTSISLSGGSITTPGNTCTITVNVTGTQAGTVTNTTGAISSTNGGTGATSNTATLIVVAAQQVTKVFGVAKIPLNGTTSLTINITNPNSTVALTGLSFTDSLPAGLVVATPSGLTNTCGGTATATAGSGSVSLSGGTVTASASCAVSVNVQGTTAGDKNNSVVVSSTEGGSSPAATATLTVVAPPAISKSFGAGSIPLNGTTTVTFVISNPNNPTIPANGDFTGLAFNDNLPVSGGPGSGTLVVSGTPNVTNTCNGSVTATAGSGVISLSGGTLAHNSSCTINVDVKGTVEGDANNTTGAVSSTEGGTGVGSNTALLKVVAPPTISKAFGAANVQLNGTTTLTFTITNPASNTSAENGIAFSDTLTNGLQVASTPGVSNTCSGTVVAAANSTSISLTGGTIATPGATCTIVVNVTATQSTTVSNTTGPISSTNGGTGATSNTATLAVCGSGAVANTNDAGAGSLRQAILDACDGGTITFDTAGVFSTPQTITLTTGELGIGKNLTINGPAAAGNHVTISGNNASRVLNVSLGKAVNISNLTISNGNLAAGLGGGINNGGTLTLTGMTLSGNSAAAGAGLFNDGTVTISNSTITGNSTTGGSGGGGVFNQSSATLRITGSTFTGNTTTGNGGGIYDNSGVTTIADSTFSNNSASNTGGGIFNQGSSLVNVTNSTLSGNTALGNGGGIFNSGGTTLTNVTISGNHSDNDNGGGEKGGGIFLLNGGTMALRNTIVAGNFIGSAATVADDIQGAGSATGSFNLIGTGGSGGLTNGTNNNQVGVANPGLGALASNGGTTQTMALLLGSPATDAGTDVTTLNGAIDNVTTTVVVTDGLSIPGGVGFVIQIDNEQMVVTARAVNTLTVTRSAPVAHSDGAAVNPAFDQRGPGFARKAGASVDIGAFEAAQADLSITKTDGVTTVVPGGSVTYTITVTNSGPSNANGASVADTFPGILTGVTFTSVAAGGATGNTAIGAGNISDTVNLPSGSSITYTANATVSPAATGSLSNTATVTAPAGLTDSNPGNNSATDTDTLTPQADLSITKTDGVANVVPGTPVTYTITVMNNGPNAANGASVADTFPGILIGVSFTSVAAGGATGNTASGSGNINDTVNLPSGGSITYTVNATVSSSATGTLSNTATVTAPGGVTDPNPGNNSATDTDTLTPQADLSITKTDGVTTVAPGVPVTYTITVTNNGPSAANGAPVADIFPGSLTGVAFTSVAAGGATGNTASGSGNISDSVNLPSGSSITYTVNATVSSSATGSLSNTATVTAPGGVTDPNPGNNSATDTDTLTPSADLSITKGDSPDPVLPNANITYTITVTNNGPSDAQSLSLSDAVPTNTTFVSVTTPAGWTRTDAVPIGGTGTITFTATSQAASASSVFTLVVHVNPATPDNTTISNTANVSSTTTDPTPGNNSATATTLVRSTPDMKVQDAQLPEPASGNANMLFTVTLSIPAPAGGTSVNFATADQAPGAGHAVGAASCNGTTVDYVTSSGTLNFAAGEQIKTIPVPICADNNNAEPNETFLVNLSSPTNATIVDTQAVGTITTTNTAGTFIISELRTSGPAGLGDDFVELYNNQDVPFTVAASDASGGYGLFKLGANCSATPVLIGFIPNGTTIPARGHYLLVGSAYSLSNYGGVGAAAGDQTLTADIESDRNIGLFSTADVTNLSTVTRFDAVGFDNNTNTGGSAPNGVCDLLLEGNTLPAASGSTLEYSFFRTECGFQGSACTVNGLPKDTNNNSADFLFVDTTGAATTMGQRLGAPGPQNKTSGIQRNATLIVPLLDSTIAPAGVPNAFRDPTPNTPNATVGPNGTYSIRRRIQNNTGGSVTALRFRIIEISTKPAPPGNADLRAITSADTPVSNIHDTTTCINRTSGTASNCTVTVKGTTLEQPPNQTIGGGYNSTLRVDLSGLPGGALAAGSSVEIQLLFGVVQPGHFRLFVNVEDDVIGGDEKAAGMTLASFVEESTVRVNQSINFATLGGKSFGDPDFTLSAAATSGLPVTFGGSGQCTVTSSGLVHLTGTGSCAVTASQPGDEKNNPAPDVIQTFTIGKAATATALSASESPVKLAQNVTLTANVGSAVNLVAPTGTVQFKDGGVNIGAPVTIDASGVAAMTTSALTAGTHSITAEFSGNANFNGSTGAFSLVVSNRPLVNFNAANYSVNESNGFVEIVINRAGDLSVPVTVDYATSDNGAINCAGLNGAASARCNFGAMFGTLRFAAGETQKTLDIPITLEAYNHGPESFTVNLSNVTGTDATLVTPFAANVTINDSASTTPNTIDDTTNFVRQQYHDFLNREPDAAGLQFWKDNIDSCNTPAGAAGFASAAQCVQVKRITTSAAFFLSIEFRGTGGMVRDFYVAALDRPATNNMPDIVEFTRDTQAAQAGLIVGKPNWEQTLNANRVAFMNDFVMRPEVVGLYPTSDTPDQYVDKLYQHANVTPANAQERLDAIAEFGNAAAASDAGARGRALLRITENAAFQAREFNRGFVQMQYFGYLRRNPSDAPDSNITGFNFWVNKLNQFNGDFIAAEMVKAFLNSQEYRQRFGTP